MFYLISAAASIFPMLAYLVIIWKADRYDKEPFKIVMQSYLWGGLGAVILTLLFSSLLSEVAALFIYGSRLKHFETIILAPVIEETMKGIFLLIISTNRNYDNVTDGIVYGGAVGLGFGTTENFLYFITYGTSLNNWLYLVIVRTLFSGVMHCIATSSLGAFLSYARLKEGSVKILITLLGFITAMLLHFTWNLSVSFNSTAVNGFISMAFVIISFIIIFLVSVKTEKRIIFRELLEEANNGLIPYDYLHILNSGKRNKKGWIDEEKRKSYVKAAVTLAFRKMQYRISAGSNRYYCGRDIEYYRLLLQNHLQTSVPEINEQK